MFYVLNSADFGLILTWLSFEQVPVYIGAQVLASLCAAFALKVIFHPMMGGGVTVPSGGHGQAFALEFIISFILMFVVTAVATDTRAVSTCYLISSLQTLFH
jgi:aquaporin NIP